jgi:hypothetical protein
MRSVVLIDFSASRMDGKVKTAALLWKNMWKNGSVLAPGSSEVAVAQTLKTSRKLRTKLNC